MLGEGSGGEGAVHPTASTQYITRGKALEFGTGPVSASANRDITLVADQTRPVVRQAHNWPADPGLRGLVLG